MQESVMTVDELSSGDEVSGTGQYLCLDRHLFAGAITNKLAPSNKQV